MQAIRIRRAEEGDVASMAAIRAHEWNSDDFWKARIASYLAGTYSPKQALPARAVYVATHTDHVVGFVAGHLTRRFECDGELQWINVAAGHRRQGIAESLFAATKQWFSQKNACRICVNVAADNLAARRLYSRLGATSMNDAWMVWEQIGESHA